MFQFEGLGALFGGLSLPKQAPTRGDGTEKTVDKSWRSCRSYYFFLQTFM